MLVRRDAPAESLIVTGARVLDPAQGVDAQIDVRIDDGVIAQLGTSLERNVAQSTLTSPRPAALACFSIIFWSSMTMNCM